jgi:hypothetical protein
MNPELNHARSRKALDGVLSLVLSKHGGALAGRHRYALPAIIFLTKALAVSRLNCPQLSMSGLLEQHFQFV